MQLPLILDMLLQQAIVDLEQQLGEKQQQVEEAEQREMAARDALAMKRCAGSLRESSHIPCRSWSCIVHDARGQLTT